MLVRKGHHSLGSRVEATEMSFVASVYLNELFGLWHVTIVAFF